MAQSPLKFVVVSLFLILALQGTRAQCPSGSQAITYDITCESTTAGDSNAACTEDEPLGGTLVQLECVFLKEEPTNNCVRLTANGLTITGNLRNGQTSCQGRVDGCIIPDAAADSSDSR